jgi:hypothetical protein
MFANLSMGAVTMPLEHEMAELLTGHHFFLHSEPKSRQHRERTK